MFNRIPPTLSTGTSARALPYNFHGHGSALCVPLTQSLEHHLATDLSQLMDTLEHPHADIYGGAVAHPRGTYARWA